MESASGQYSTESTTTEVYEVPTYAKRLLCFAITGQTVCCLLLITFGAIALTNCSEIQYTGFTVFLGIFFFALQLGTIYVSYSKKRKCSLITSSVSLLLVVFLVLHEAACWNCTVNSDLDDTAFCETWRNNTNLCKVMHKRKKAKGGRHATTTTGTLASESSNSTTAPGYSKFYSERTTMLALSVLCMACCIISLIVLCVAVKLGKPVYLNRRRHKGSIVVGHSLNVEIGNRNKLKNIISLEPNDAEMNLFEQRKAEIVAEYFTESMSPVRKAAHRKTPITNLKDSETPPRKTAATMAESGATNPTWSVSGAKSSVKSSGSSPKKSSRASSPVPSPPGSINQASKGGRSSSPSPTRSTQSTSGEANA